MVAVLPGLEVRRATPDDEVAIIDLARASLGWDHEGPHHELFRWKHLDNPFGPSPMWVAELDGRLVGFRTFLRWELSSPGRGLVQAVRAVDTATHPEAQGRGIFRALTMHAIAELQSDGTACVFNTPNDQSRPGYLKMGWQALGHLPIRVVPSGPAGAARMVTARQPAHKWSLPCNAGEPGASYFSDEDAVARLLAALPVDDRLRTVRSPAYLQWRYRFEPLRYRCVPLGDRVEDGCVVVRVRVRGKAREATVCDVLLPSRRTAAARALLRELPRHLGADYALVTAHDAPHAGFPLPRQGPIVTWRPLADSLTPSFASLGFSLGDIELF